jgi:hypothetical protein
MSSRRFLTRLFAACSGVVELRALPSTARVWAPVNDWSRLGPFITTQVAAEQDLYVGIATRRDSSSGRADNLAELPAVWVDLDAPLAALTERFRDFPFPWSLLVRSGLYHHGYLILRESLDLTVPANLSRAASVLRRLSGYCGGDDRCADPARVLRLPGTYSFKYDEARPVTLIAETDAVVNLSELEDFLPREIIRRNEMQIEASIPCGARNDTLYLVGRSLRCRGVAVPVIDRTLRVLNEVHCERPLPDAELRALLRQVLTQPDRPDFVGPRPRPVVHLRSDS